MASSQETLAFINNDDGVMEIKGNLLMSLMEELPINDESNDERLDSLIRYFEAEISGSNKITQLKSNFEEVAESWNIEHVEGQDYWDSSSSTEEFGVEWVDMDLMTFDDGNWGVVDSCGDYEKVFMVCEGFDLEEHAYNYFWQDNYEMQLVLTPSGLIYKQQTTL